MRLSTPLFAIVLVVSGCTVSVRAPRRTTLRAAASASVGVPPQVVVSQAPPPAREPIAARPAAPAEGAVWVPGHWDHSNNGWFWVPGAWQEGHRGQAWVEPVVRPEAGGTVYCPGYWRGEDDAPDPTYTGSGVVIISAGRGVTATAPGARNPNRRTVPSPPSVPQPPTTGRGVTATAPGARNPNRRTAQGGTVTAPTPPAPPTRPATTRPATTGRGVTATAPGARNPNRRTAQGGTVTAPARPSTGRPGTPAPPRTTPSRRAATGGAVTGGGTIYTPETRPGRGQPRPTPITPRTEQRGGVVVTRPMETPRTEQRGGVVVTRPMETPRTEQRGGVVVTRPPATRPPATRPPTATDGRPPVARPVRPVVPVSPTANLTCAVRAARAPRGGLITITGTGFARPSVRVAGQLSRISRRSSTSLTVSVPGQPGYGNVTITDGGRTASCGRIQIL